MSQRNLASRRAANSNLLPIGGIRDPLSLPGCVAWYDFSASAYLATGTNGTGAVSNGSAIGYCLDRSGNGNNVTQGTANSRPTWNSTGINSLGAGSFASASSQLLASSTIAAFSGDLDITVLCVATRASTTAGAQWRIVDAATTTTGLGLADGAGGQTRMGVSGNATNATATYSAATSAAVLTYQSSSGGVHLLRYWRNGAAIAITGTAVGSRSLASSLLQIGVMSGIGFHNGLIAELAIYTRSLTAAEVLGVNRYLGAKWGITVA
jgi:hypothetical protein